MNSPRAATAEATSPPIAFPSVPSSVLATLLDAGGPSTGLSLRPHLGEATPLDVHQRVALAASDMVTSPRLDEPLQCTPAFENALAVLRAPATAVEVRLWTGDDLHRHQATVFFPPSLDAQTTGGATCTPARDGGWQVSAPIEPDDLLDAVVPTLAGVRDDPPAEVEVHLPGDAIRVLATLLDAGGETRTLTALRRDLSRSGSELSSSRLADVAGVVVGDLGTMSRQRVDAGVGMLEAAGLVRNEQLTGVEPVGPVQALARSLVPVVAGMRWTRRGRGSSGGEPVDTISDLAVLVGPDGSAIGITTTGDGWAGIRTATKDTLGRFFSGEMAAIHAPAAFATRLLG